MADSDNRQYQYVPGPSARRMEYETIIQWIHPGARVLDLGCGEGSLLEELIQRKKVVGEGMEASPTGVEICRRKGLSVREGKIDSGALPWADRSFDIAICNVTLQMVMYPEKLVGEMMRLATTLIISFPNFANIRNRWELLIRGRMPRAMLFGHAWWNTGHLHQLSTRDFQEFAKNHSLQITRTCHFGALARWGFCRVFPNLFSTIALFELTSGDRSRPTR
jgi:methionine biosynthesis protein MetW